MSKFTFSKNSFKSGELSPKLEGRTDINEYFDGAATMQNFIPARDNGAIRRPGSRLIADLTNDYSWSRASLYPFIVSRTESFVLAINNLAAEVRMFKMDYSGKNPVATASSVIEAGILVRDAIQTVDASKFNYAQVNNLLFLTHTSGTIPPILIQRTGTAPDTFTMSFYHRYKETDIINPIRVCPFTPINTDSAVTLTWNGLAGELDASSPIFNAGMVSSPSLFFIRMFTDNNENKEIVLRATGFFSTTKLIVDVIILPSGVGATDTLSNRPKWAFSSWNNFYGWPRAVSVFQQRLCFGGTNNEPNTIWFSATENLFLLINSKLVQDISASVTTKSALDYWGPITTQDAFDISLSSNQSNIIQWMTSDRFLQVGSTSTEYIVTTVDGKFGPANANAAAQTFFGSNDTGAIRAQSSTMFISTDGKSIREIRYSEENGSNVSRLISVLSDQMVYHNMDQALESMYDVEFVQMAYQPSRSCVWIVTSSKELVGITIEQSSNTLAWHKHIIAGTDTEILGMCVVPDDIGRHDMLYLTVKRTTPSGVITTLEAIGGDFEADRLFGHYNTDNRNFPIYVDSCYVGETFSHGPGLVDAPVVLKNEGTVQLLVKGVYIGERTVKTDLGGSPYVDVEDPTVISGDVIMGLRYDRTSILESMAIEAGGQTGNSLIQIKRIDSFLLKLFRSRRFRIGTKSNNVETIDLTNAKDSLELFDGDKRVLVESSPDETQRFYITAEGPFPLHILAVIMRGVTQD